MFGRDMSRRWARSEQGGKVCAAHVFLCADICEEFGEACLRIQPRREQQAAGAIVLATELRIGTALLEEDGHDLEGILCQGLLRAKRPRRKQQDIVGCTVQIQLALPIVTSLRMPCTHACRSQSHGSALAGILAQSRRDYLWTCALVWPALTRPNGPKPATRATNSSGSANPTSVPGPEAASSRAHYAPLQP